MVHRSKPSKGDEDFMKCYTVDGKSLVRQETDTYRKTQGIPLKKNSTGTTGLLPKNNNATEVTKKT